MKRRLLLGFLIITALLAFEIFNYSTTDFALTDLLGGLSFIGVRWATILSIAFCGIDFAGIARLFTPEEKNDKPAEVWYMFGAWMIAAVMNALLTWWGVSIAIANNETLGSSVVGRETLLAIVPVFVAVMVWLIRVLIIGTLSMSGDRLFNQSSVKKTSQPMAAALKPKSRANTQNRKRSIRPLSNTRASTIQSEVSASSHRPSHQRGTATKHKQQSEFDAEYNPAEPTYTPVAMSGNRRSNRSQRSRFQ